MINKSITHITTVHPRYDTRVFVKECKSIKRNGLNVNLIVADGLGNEIKEGINIIDLGKPRSRLIRMVFYSRKAYRMAKNINCDIYHFHDPELLPLGIKLTKRGNKVVYDVHEDVPKQILTKPYLNKFLAKLISKIFEKYENRCSSKFSAIITATPFIRERFLKFNKTTTEVQNFPFLDEFPTVSENSKTKNSVCYIGSITEVRGIRNMIKSLEFTNDIKLNLGGAFNSIQLRSEVSKLLGWEKVNELGFLDRIQVKSVLDESIAGLVVLKPTINYLDSIPVKMFEYMASGIPVIASDFPYWKDLIEDVGCAIFVNPEDPKEIGLAMQKLVDDPMEAKLMGAKGREAILRKFNWDNEESKLMGAYLKLIEG